MRLSEYLNLTGCMYSLISNGEFSVLEQCTRIRSPHALVYIETESFLENLNNPDISCVICPHTLKDSIPRHITGVCVTEHPKVIFFKIHNILQAKQKKHPTVIASTARISPLAYVAEHNVSIGEDVEIHPFVVVNENSVLEDHARICSGTVIGAQGYTVIKEGGDRAFIAHDAGRTVIGRGVQIGSNCVIECGAMENDTTQIGAYSMIDNGVLIGHGTVMGQRGLIAAEAIISGNCAFGSRIWIGVNATISNAITMGDDARVSLGAVVTKDVPAGETVTGNLAIPHERFMRNLKMSISEISNSGEMPPRGQS